MSEAVITLLVLAVCVALFISNRLPVGVVAILTSLSLPALGSSTSGAAGRSRCHGARPARRGTRAVPTDR